MIRINLIRGARARKSKAQWDVHLELAAGIGLVVGVLGFCMYYSGSLTEQIEARQRDIQQKNQQVAVLKQKVKKVEDFEKKKKLLESRNKVIEQLEKRRTGPVRVLDEVSRSLEPMKIWLVNLKVKGKNIEMKAEALENDDVVGFINNLRRTERFQNIQLMEIRAKQQNSVRVFEFRLTMGRKG